MCCSCHGTFGSNHGWANHEPYLRLRGGGEGLDVVPLSEESISVSGSDSGRYWEENFELPKGLKDEVLTGARKYSNISEVFGDLEPRINGQKVCNVCGPFMILLLVYCEGCDTV